MPGAHRRLAPHPPGRHRAGGGSPREPPPGGRGGGARQEWLWIIRIPGMDEVMGMVLMLRAPSLARV